MAETETAAAATAAVTLAAAAAAMAAAVMAVAAMATAPATSETRFQSGCAVTTVEVAATAAEVAERHDCAQWR